ncbi:MAG: hypothetical protein GXP08_11710 [Gammaproteobacteria bacterium]|nr:hypothetical protein [Gammaproteobacteria bacterium]
MALLLFCFGGTQAVEHPVTQAHDFGADPGHYYLLPTAVDTAEAPFKSS